jgi:zinc transporter ZupT
VALAAHRFLEGSAIALAGSAAVAVALAVHAFGEGLAIGALLALAAGVLAQAARVSLHAAFHGPGTSRILLSQPAATTTMAAIVTALAVHAPG